jgi:hypothetical protein
MFRLIAEESPGTHRSRWVAGTVAGLTAVLTLVSFPHAAVAEPASVPTPSVTGPIPTTAESHPWLSAALPGVAATDGTDDASIDLAAHGYLEEEFFIEGTARKYSATGEESGEEPYKTRIVVRRPADAQMADGTVVMEWMNVTAQFDLEVDWHSSHAHFMRNGYTWVGVSAQRAGVQALRGFDTERYAGLTVGEDPATADAQSWDVFSQAAQVVRSDGENDPLPGIEVERLIATGHSQSAARLVTYYNAIQPQHDLIDGFIIHGISTPLRTDLQIPVIRALAEGDVNAQTESAEPDGEFYRRWEVAGTSHIGYADQRVSSVLLNRDRPGRAPMPCDRPTYSRIPFHHVLNAAYAHMVTWIDAGVAPPKAPRLKWTDATTIARDARGNALGGIQLPDHSVATALNDGENTGAVFCFLFGAHIPFDEETLSTLYPSHANYVSAVRTATDNVVEAGFLLKPDARVTRRQAAESTIGRQKTRSQVFVGVVDLARTYGSPRLVAVSATVGSDAGTGAVSLTIDNGIPVEVPLVNGVGFYTIPGTTPVGGHRVVAAFPGSATVAASSATAPLVVTKASTRTRVTLSRSTVRLGKPIKARVTTTINGSTSVKPTGTVVVKVGSRTVGSGKVRNGVATVRIAKPTRRGKYSLKVRFTGNGNYSGSSSIVKLRVTR